MRGRLRARRGGVHLPAVRDRGNPRRRIRPRAHRADLRPVGPRGRPRSVALALPGSPAPSRRRRPAAPPGGLHARGRGAGAREGARPRRLLRQGRRPQPHRLVQGPRQLGGRHARAVARPEGDHLLVDRQRGFVAGRLRGRGGDEGVHLRAGFGAGGEGRPAPRVRGEGVPRRRSRTRTRSGRASPRSRPSAGTTATARSTRISSRGRRPAAWRSPSRCAAGCPTS